MSGLSTGSWEPEITAAVSSPTTAKSQPKLSWTSGIRQPTLPRRIPVELAVLEKRAPEGEDWLHEIKLDGYRMLARIEEGRARLVTRNDQDWTARFPELAEAFVSLSRPGTVFDGEIVRLKQDGISSFAALQEALSDEDSGNLSTTLSICCSLMGSISADRGWRNESSYWPGH